LCGRVDGGAFAGANQLGKVSLGEQGGIEGNETKVLQTKRVLKNGKLESIEVRGEGAMDGGLQRKKGGNS